MLKGMMRRLEAIEACRFRTPRVAAILRGFRTVPNPPELHRRIGIFDMRTLSKEEIDVLLAEFAKIP